MAKRSQRRAVRYEKDQSGCIWGLISMFDFRRGRSVQKLLSDRKRGGKHDVGIGKSSNRFETLTNLGEGCTIDGEECKTVDVGKPSVKKLMEEEMIIEKEPKKEKSKAKAEAKQYDSGVESHLRTGQKRMKRSSKKSLDMDTRDLSTAENLGSERSSHQTNEKQSVNNLSEDKIVEEFSRRIHQRTSSFVKHDQDGKSENYVSDFEEKLAEAINRFVGQKFINWKDFTEDQRIQHSREIMSALEISSSDEQLFLKLLQNQNSLLVEYVQNFHKALTEKAKQSDELVDHKHSFFKRKVNSRESTLAKGNEKSEASNTIVILKPGLTGTGNYEADSSLHLSSKSNYSFEGKVPNEKLGSHFLLVELKRKFRHALGKDRQKISTNSISNGIPKNARDSGAGEKGVSKETIGRKLPTKDHFYIERIAKPPVSGSRVDKNGKSTDFGTKTEFESDEHPRKEISNIYIEAKKHLSEILSSGDEGVEFLTGQMPKSLGRILSLPEYSSSPIGSPRKEWDHSFVTAQMRFSTFGRYSNVNENTSSPRREISGSCTSPTKSQLCFSDDRPDDVQAQNKPDILEEIIDENRKEETVSITKDETSAEGDVEVLKEIEITVHEERNAVDAPSELTCSTSTPEYQDGDTSDTCANERLSKSLDQDLHEENQSPSSPFASPSSSSIIRKTDEDLECPADIPERRSPVSILEPLFSEDDTSPRNTMSQPAVHLMQPLRIQFEEHDPSDTDQVNNTKPCLDDKELIFDYVKRVLLASGLNRKIVCLKWLSSEQLLDPSLVDEVEFSNSLCYDQKLLFDCINEVLIDVCRPYSLCLSFGKPRVRAVLDLKDYFDDICKGVHWHILPLPLPRTLDQIVRKDMERTGTWMDLTNDAEIISTETSDAILEDLVDDTIFSCVRESSELGFHINPPEKEKENEIEIIL